MQPEPPRGLNSYSNTPPSWGEIPSEEQLPFPVEAPQSDGLIPDPQFTWGEDEETEGAEDSWAQRAEEEMQSAPGAVGLLKMVLTLVGVAIAFFAVKFIFFSYPQIYVEGNVAFQPGQVAEIAGMSTNSNYFNVRVEDVSRSIQSNRYLQFVAFEKIFPNKFYIHIKERRPAAVFSYIGQDYLLSSDGMVLERGKTLQGLGHLIRIEGLEVAALQEISVGQVLPTKGSRRVEHIAILLQELERQQLFPLVRVIRYSNDDAIHFYVRDGFVANVGNEHQMRAKVATVRAVLAELGKRNITHGMIEATVPGNATYIPEEKKDVAP